GGLTDVPTCLAQLRHVDGVMVGRAAYQDLGLIAALDSHLFGTERRSEQHVLAAYLSYAERELAQGTPLRAVARHLFGLRAGQAGGRRWRRDLTFLPEGRAGLARLRELATSFGSESPAPLPAVELAFTHS